MAVDDYTGKIFLIDTNSYAGNFERELCAYVTGQYGDCQIGKETAEDAALEVAHVAWWSDHIEQTEDDAHRFRPVSIWPTPGYFNNGHGGIFQDVSENYEVARLAGIEAAERYSEQSCARVRSANWTEETCEVYLAREEENLNRIRTVPLKKYPAYCSVAIFVDADVPVEVWQEAVERAQEWVRDRNAGSDDNIEIECFRVVEAHDGKETLTLKQVAVANMPTSPHM